jgi:hypothetical protein
VPRPPCLPPPPVATDGAWSSPPCPPPPPLPPYLPPPPVATDGAWSSPYHVYILNLIFVDSVKVELRVTGHTEPQGGQSDREGDRQTRSAPIRRPKARPPREGDPVPHWDPESRELTFDGKLCKRYTQDPGNQGKIYQAFQGDGWPTSTDDPLPGPDLTRKRKLTDTLRHMKDIKHITFRYQKPDRIEWLILEPP